MSVAVIEYVLMLLGVLALNLFFISQLSRATIADFTSVQGSDYLQVCFTPLAHCTVRCQGSHDRFGGCARLRLPLCLLHTTSPKRIQV